MLELIHSIPDRCVRCQSDNLSGKPLIDDGNTLITCNACGTWMAIPEQEGEETDEIELGYAEVSASFQTCPHCKNVDAITVYGGEEVCQNCGLDPNKEDYPSEEIAHLWKEGSSIRGFLERGRCRPTSNIGTFFRKFCGPHCTYAEDCPQDTKQFQTCYSESRNDVLRITSPHLLQIEDEFDMGKRRQKNRRRKQRAAQKEAEQRKTSVFVCRTGGWLERYLRINHETSRKEGASATGS
jgi:hypothetical protein